MSVEQAKTSKRTHPLLDAVTSKPNAYEGGGELVGVTTRFQLKHPWQLFALYVAYRRLKPDLRAAPGLIRYAFLLESPIACCAFSIWESEQALMAFSNISSHIKAVRQAKHLCRHIWSVYWRGYAISEYANQWPGAVPWPALLGSLRPAHSVERMVEKGAAE